MPTQVGIFLVYFGLEIPAYAAVRRIGITKSWGDIKPAIPVREDFTPAIPGGRPMHKDVLVPRSARMRESGLRAALRAVQNGSPCRFVNLGFGERIWRAHPCARPYGCALRAHRHFAPGEMVNLGFGSILPTNSTEKFSLEP